MGEVGLVGGVSSMVVVLGCEEVETGARMK